MLQIFSWSLNYLQLLRIVNLIANFIFWCSSNFLLLVAAMLLKLWNTVYFLPTV